VVLAGPPAWADSASDPRATFTSGNVTTCAGSGLSGDTQLGANGTTSASDSGVSGTVGSDGKALSVTLVNPNDVIDAVIVKGGNGYNSYTNGEYLPPTLSAPQNYVPPFTNGNTVPTISHWFVCYHAGAPSTLPESPLAIGLPLTAMAMLGGAGYVVVRRRQHLPEV
jgi:hypothetical protein